jgi:hypothetical protein
MGPGYIATPVLVKETLDLGPEGYMSAMTYFFVGLALGTAASWWSARHIPKGRLILLGILLDSLTCLPLFFCHSLLAVQMALLAHAFVIPLIIIPRTVLIQRALPGHLHGRLFALVNVTVFGMTGISAGLAGVLIEHMQPGTLFLMVGITGTIAALFGFRITALRTAR